MKRHQYKTVQISEKVKLKSGLEEAIHSFLLSKDVLFSLSFQSPKKTLEDKDVNSIITEIINIVSKKFNAKLRDN